MKECTFFVEIYAPQGLKGIEDYINICQMKLNAYDSGFNKKVVLNKRKGEDLFDWRMDTSTEDTVQANGIFFCDVERSKELIQSLSYT